MKRFTEISENFSQTLDTNPGNAMKMASQSGMKMPSMPSTPSIRMPSSGSFKI